MQLHERPTKQFSEHCRCHISVWHADAVTRDHLIQNCSLETVYFAITFSTNSILHASKGNLNRLFPIRQPLQLLAPPPMSSQKRKKKKKKSKKNIELTDLGLEEGVHRKSLEKKEKKTQEQSGQTRNEREKSVKRKEEGCLRYHHWQ